MSTQHAKACATWDRGSEPASVLAGFDEISGQIFVLVGGDQVHAGFVSGFPACHHRLARAKVIALVPAAVFGFGKSVESVETNPVTQLMCVIDQGAEALVRRRSPFAGFGLSAFLDFEPGIIPP